MSRRDLSLFFGAFFLTLILAGWITVFLIVDGSSARYESSATVPALEMRRSGEMTYDLAVLGQEYWFSVAPLNGWERFRKEYACLVTPRGMLNLEKALDYAAYGRRAAYVRYKENQYIQNVLRSQENVPVA